MTIYEQFKELLKNREGDIVTNAEVKSKLNKTYATKYESIFLSDYCYNRINNGIRFDKHIFEFLGGGEYKYLGEYYPYTGKIFHKPLHQQIKEVGEWINGVKHRYPPE